MKTCNETIRNQMVPEKVSRRDPIHNQDGSIIIIALMVLVIMTVIGLMSSSSVVTENFIIRNEGIYRQNINMVESAMMLQLQQFMQIAPDSPSITDVNASPLAWVKNMNNNWAATTWYARDSSARVLDNTNSVPVVFTAGDPDNPLVQRGEANAGNLRTAFVGWDIVPLSGGGSESLGVGTNQPVWRRGRLIAEYESRTANGADHGYGMLRMEIGVKRRIIIN